MLVAILTNSSFLGIPLLNTYLPNDNFMPYLLVYDQLGTFLAFAIYGTFIVSIYTSKTKVSPVMIAGGVAAEERGRPRRGGARREADAANLWTREIDAGDAK